MHTKLSEYNIRGYRFILLAVIIIVWYGNLDALLQYAYAGTEGYRISLTIYHNERGAAIICLIPENQDRDCYRIDDLSSYKNPIKRELQPPSVEIGETLRVCVTNLEIDRTTCQTEENNRGGLEHVTLTVPQAQTFYPEWLFGLIIATIFIIVIIIIKLRRKTKPAGNIDFE